MSEVPPIVRSLEETEEISEPTTQTHPPISPSTLCNSLTSACESKWSKISSCIAQDAITSVLDYRELRIKAMESQLCKVCWERLACVVIDDCGHLCLCRECSSLAFDFCPVCRCPAKRHWIVQA